MKITKFGHACLLVEKNGVNLLIDPGSFTDLPDDLPVIDAVIVSEEHYDHFNLDNLQKITSTEDSLQIYTTESVAQQIAEHNFSVHTITDSTTVDVQGVKITLTPIDHAVVYQKSPCISLTIAIDNDLYYPSDSFTVTDQKYKVLALPTSGPWFKVESAIEFTNAVASDIVIATHNALNSEIGNDVTHKFITANISPDRQFVHLQNGESLDA